MQQKLDDNDVEDDSGTGYESPEQHRRRHPKVDASCARCIYLSRRAVWEIRYGCHRSRVAGQVKATIWLAQRPAHRGGAWALGCVFCAAAFTRGTPRGIGKGKGFRGCVWSRFEVRTIGQISQRAVRQHAETDSHRQAVRMYFAPPAAKVLELGSHGVSESDDRLFRGGVPQADDWLHAWRSCKTPVSFHAAEAHGITCNFIHGSRGEVATSRKAFRSGRLPPDEARRALWQAALEGAAGHQLAGQLATGGARRSALQPR